MKCLRHQSNKSFVCRGRSNEVKRVVWEGVGHDRFILVADCVCGEVLAEEMRNELVDLDNAGLDRVAFDP